MNFIWLIIIKMDFNKFTIKASEAVQSAHDLALKNKHGQIDELHLFIAMLEQKDGYIPMILKKINIELSNIKTRTESELNKNNQIE